MKKFLKNVKSGVVFNFSDILAKREDMVLCDVTGDPVSSGSAGKSVEVKEPKKKVKKEKDESSKKPEAPSVKKRSKKPASVSEES